MTEPVETELLSIEVPFFQMQFLKSLGTSSCCLELKYLPRVFSLNCHVDSECKYLGVLPARLTSLLELIKNNIRITTKKTKPDVKTCTFYRTNEISDCTQSLGVTLDFLHQLTGCSWRVKTPAYHHTAGKSQHLQLSRRTCKSAYNTLQEVALDWEAYFSCSKLLNKETGYTYQPSKWPASLVKAR